MTATIESEKLATGPVVVDTPPPKPGPAVDEVAEAVSIEKPDKDSSAEEQAAYETLLKQKRREEKAVALMKKIRSLCDKDGFMLLPRVYYIPVPGRPDGAQIQRAEISLIDKPEEPGVKKS